MPSSDQIASTFCSLPCWRRVSTACDHGAWTRAPNGERTQTQNVPISSM
jgi:hypothetical protein